MKPVIAPISFDAARRISEGRAIVPCHFCAGPVKPEYTTDNFVLAGAFERRYMRIDSWHVLCNECASIHRVWRTLSDKLRYEDVE